MLARVTYALVVVAVGTLIGGFFTEDSNVLLFISIGLSVAAIALVLVGWARRAREVPMGFEDELALDEEGEEGALLDALDEDELAFVDDRRRSRRSSRSKARPRTKPKAAPKAKPKATAKPKPRSSAAPRKRGKPSVTKPKPARKAKPKSTGKGGARPKRKPPRRPPGSR